MRREIEGKEIHWTTKHVIKDAVISTFRALELVAVEDPDAVLATFDSHGGIESVSVPGWSEQLSELDSMFEE